MKIERLALALILRLVYLIWLKMMWGEHTQSSLPDHIAHEMKNVGTNVDEVTKLLNQGPYP